MRPQSFTRSFEDVGAGSGALDRDGNFRQRLQQRLSVQIAQGVPL